MKCWRRRLEAKGGRLNEKGKRLDVKCWRRRPWRQKAAGTERGKVKCSM